jgi:serine/threonine protein phosphatase PrpC
MTMQFTFFGTSHTGYQREHNEDSYLCNPEETLFLVADGIGGLASGEIASKEAIKCMETFVVRSRSEDLTWPMPYRKDLTLEQNRLLAAATLAHRRINGLANQDPAMKGMGTTVVGVIIEGDRLALVNVGDSRLYRIRDGEIEQLTEDHSLVAEQERKGLLTKEEANRHPQKHILTSALGIGPIENITIDLSLLEIREKDLYLICSDGLTDMIGDKEILTTANVFESKSLKKIGLSLIQQANLAGGRDNITVILLSFYKES